MIKSLQKKIKSVYKNLPAVKKGVYYKKIDRLKIVGEIPFSFDIKTELNQLIVAYLLYLDKKRKINCIKFGFIKDYFPFRGLLFKEDISTFITDSMAFRKSFYQTVPYIFSAFIDTNNTVNQFNEKNNIKEKNYMACELLDLYKIVGQYYLECDGRVIEADVAERYATYMLMLEEELEEKLENGLYELYKKI